jgi:hypothetical protein
MRVWTCRIQVRRDSQSVQSSGIHVHGEGQFRVSIPAWPKCGVGAQCAGNLQWAVPKFEFQAWAPHAWPRAVTIQLSYRVMHPLEWRQLYWAYEQDIWCCYRSGRARKVSVLWIVAAIRRTLLSPSSGQKALFISNKETNAPPIYW